MLFPSIKIPFFEAFFKNKREFAISFYFIKFYFLTLLFLSTFHFSKEEGMEGNSNCLLISAIYEISMIYHINSFKMVPEFSRTGRNIDWFLIVTVRFATFWFDEFFHGNFYRLHRAKFEKHCYLTNFLHLFRISWRHKRWLDWYWLGWFQSWKTWWFSQRKQVFFYKNWNIGFFCSSYKNLSR